MMMCGYIMLSYPLSPDAPRPPSIPKPEISDFMTIAKDGAGVMRVCFYNHTGTHVDTASHVIEDGISIEHFDIPDLIFDSVALIDLSLPDSHPIVPSDLLPYRKRIKCCEMLIVRCGIGQIRKYEPVRFSGHMPGFTVDAAAWLRESCPRLRCLGTDLPSFSVIADLGNTMKAHNILLRDNDRKMMIIEEMALDDAPTDIKQVLVSPWLVKGVDCGPCNVIAKI